MYKSQEFRSRNATGMRKLPWLLSVALIAFFATATALVGTALHRSGVDANLPWGLCLAYLLIGWSAAFARQRFGMMGVGFHLIVSGLVIWILATTSGVGGSVLVPVGSAAFTTFFSLRAGYFWLLGSTIVQILVMFLPKKWFRRGIPAAVHGE